MCSILHAIILLGGFIPLARGKFMDMKKGSFIGDLRYVRTCAENNENTLELYISHRKYNRTHIGIGMNITLPETFDNTYEFDFELRVWGDGGWKNNFFHLKRKNACTSLYLLLGPVWTNIIDAAKCKRGCPVAEGYYSFEDLFVDLSKMPVIVQVGRFFIFARAIKNSLITACIEAEVEIKQN